MNRLILLCFSFFLLVGPAFFAFPQAALGGADGKNIVLPAPDKTTGLPLMQALALRHANRNISDEPLSEQEISNLLWAAWGVNRPDGRHTAPTAYNKQKIAVFVALPSGVWLYDSPRHQLTLVLEQSLTPQLGAPLALIYSAAQDEASSPMHVGSIYQNAGLYCASAGLANVVKITGASDLNNTLPLPQGYAVYAFQLVGKPR